MLHYAVSPDGKVFSYRKAIDASNAATAIQGFRASDLDISAIPTPTLIVLHNIIRPEKPVTRFSDRPTAEKRMQGVLEVLAVVGTIVEPQEQDPSTMTSDTLSQALTQDQDTTMATTAARKSAKKKNGTTKRTGAKGKPGVTATPITEAEIKRVAKMRADGKNWAEIMQELGKTVSFVHRVRPLLRKVDKSLVRNTGPGSASYGTKKAK